MTGILIWLTAHKTLILALVTAIVATLQTRGVPIPAWVTMIVGLVTAGGAVHDKVQLAAVKRALLRARCGA
jgi:hypothetical protein